ncbi:MAG: leucyl aminopeptidase [Chloroflexota bacterium]|nr:leucyl aminopeptidase [Chloroflexota bacterium]
MDIQLTTQAAQEIACDALVVGASSSKEQQNAAEGLLSPTAGKLDKELGGLLSALYKEGEFKGKLGEIATIHTMGKIAAKRLILVGLGGEATPGADAIRRASATVIRHLEGTGAHTVTLALNRVDSGAEAAHGIQAEVEGALLGLYHFEQYKSKHNEQEKITAIQIVLEQAENPDLFKQAIERGRVMAEATNFARDLINEPPNVLTPTELANRASSMAARVGLECEVLDRPRMEELGMGGLLGVAQGSAEPPKFIILRYRGAPQSAEHGIALVGKGITFDTGGISLKPADGMEKMKGDMGGAAAVIGAIQAIASLKPAINVTALVPTTENMPSGTAYRPGDILRIMNGKTIEIVNTDAEGRLVLADALSYAVQKGLSPIIDVATLTGGIVVALGTTMAGLFTNNEELGKEIIAAGEAAGEKFWAMPMDEEYGEQIKSDVADIKQTGGRGASAVTAAKILEHFVGEARWAHLDIAGTSFADSKKPHQERGAVGFAVRTLAEFAAGRG